MAEERSTLVRLAPFSGAVFVILTVVGAFLGFGAIEWMASGEQIAAHLTENETSAMAGAVMMILAPLFLLWFLGSLWQRMRAAEASPARLSVVMFGGGVAFAAAHLVGASAMTGAVMRAAETGLSATYAEVAYDLGAILWSAGGGVALAALLLSFAVLAVRAGTHPAWWAWLSALLGVGLLIVPIAWIVMAGALAWVLAMSLWLGIAGWRVTAPATT